MVSIYRIGDEFIAKHLSKLLLSLALIVIENVTPIIEKKYFAICGKFIRIKRDFFFTGRNKWKYRIFLADSSCLVDNLPDLHCVLSKKAPPNKKYMVRTEIFNRYFLGLSKLLKSKKGNFF